MSRLEASRIVEVTRRAADLFNQWTLGDPEMEVREIRGSTVELLLRQGCACSLDFSLKEEVERAFREAGAEVEARVEAWDVEEGGYRASVVIKKLLG